MYRFINELLEPQRMLLLWMAAALAWLWWRERQQRRRLLAVTVPFVLLWLLCLPVTARISNWLFEGQYQPLVQRPSEPHSIVVLSGYAMPRDPRRPKPVLGDDSLYRCLHAAELYRGGPPCQVVVSGGIVDPEKDMPPLGQQMRDFLLQLGVAEEHILVEDASTTTYENAVQTAKLFSGENPKIVLVTDALHMPRAQKCFRREGFDVVPACCLMQNADWDLAWGDFLPTADAADGMRAIFHETLGLVWYKLKGRI